MEFLPKSAMHVRLATVSCATPVVGWIDAAARLSQTTQNAVKRRNSERPRAFRRGDLRLDGALLRYFLSESRISRSNRVCSGVSAAGASNVDLTRLKYRIIQKITNARMTKFRTIVRKLPYANSGTPALVSASYVIGPA